jgi:ATP synthase protein I
MAGRHNDDLDNLSKNISKLRRKEVRKHEPKPPGASAYGMRVGTDLVSGVAVGTAFGYGVDQFFGSLPFGMIIGMLLGLAAGIKLMMETAARAARDAEAEEEETDG